MGNQLSAIKGSGMDFSDYRAYQAGDDPKFIDWRASARSQQPLVRTYHQETQQSICFVIDQRAVMCFATRKRLKVTQAIRIVLYLASQKINAGYEINALLISNKTKWTMNVKTRSSLLRFANEINKACPPIEPLDEEIDWKKVFSALQYKVPKGNEIYLLSDFLMLDKNHFIALRSLANSYHVNTVRIFDAIEEQFETGNYQLHWGKQQLDKQSSNKQDVKQLKNNYQINIDYLEEQFKKYTINSISINCAVDDLSKVFA